MCLSILCSSLHARRGVRHRQHAAGRQEDGVRPRREHADVRLRDTVVLHAVVVVAVTNGVAVVGGGGGGGADALRLPICGLGGAAAARRRDVKRAAPYDGEGNLIPSTLFGLKGIGDD